MKNHEIKQIVDPVTKERVRAQKYTCMECDGDKCAKCRETGKEWRATIAAGWVVLPMYGRIGKDEYRRIIS